MKKSRTRLASYMWGRRGNVLSVIMSSEEMDGMESTHTGGQSTRVCFGIGSSGQGFVITIAIMGCETNQVRLDSVTKATIRHLELITGC